MKKTLDPKDIQLIEALRANARTPLVALAKALGLSRSATQERLQRLERNGVIKGYAAQVAWPDEAGVDVWFSVRLAAGVKCGQVVPAIVAMSEVRLCHALAGDIDLLVRASASDLDRASALRERLAALAGIQAVTTHVVLAAHR
ncbi:MAG: Lrp/AsnC family transcriptional regulator [Rubrivivax sp.]